MATASRVWPTVLLLACVIAHYAVQCSRVKSWLACIGSHFDDHGEMPDPKVPQSSPASHSPFAFSRQSLDCAVGGRSVLDIPRLEVHNRAEAYEFIRAYGYEPTNRADLEELWATYNRALAMIREQLLESGEDIPFELSEPTKLEDISDLLVYASSREPGTAHLQRWACSILRVMHVYVHLRNDLFSAFRDEIQGQILKPLESVIVRAGQTTWVGDEARIPLERFEVKPFKTTASSVIKLLARPERVALTLLDKLGVRFVTHSVFDSFRVVRFLIDSHIVSYPHIIPDQSANTLYPLNLFFEAMDELEHSQAGAGSMSDEMINEWLKKSFEESSTRAEYLGKLNQFSGPDHRFIKFINRKLITVPVGEGEMKRSFRFFYPFEIQIMDVETWRSTQTGPTAHDQYKDRQRKRARERVFGSAHEVL